MVSDGKEFSIDVPPRNTFIRGLNHQVIPPRKDVPVTVRPQHIFEALAIDALDGADPSLISLEEDRAGRTGVLHSALSSVVTPMEVLVSEKEDLVRPARSQHREAASLHSKGAGWNPRSFTVTSAPWTGMSIRRLVRFERPQESYRMAIRADRHTGQRQPGRRRLRAEETADPPGSRPDPRPPAGNSELRVSSE